MGSIGGSVEAHRKLEALGGGAQVMVQASDLGCKLAGLLASFFPTI